MGSDHHRRHKIVYSPLSERMHLTCDRLSSFGHVYIVRIKNVTILTRNLQSIFTSLCTHFPSQLHPHPPITTVTCPKAQDLTHVIKTLRTACHLILGQYTFCSPVMNWHVSNPFYILPSDLSPSLYLFINFS